MCMCQKKECNKAMKVIMCVVDVLTIAAAVYTVYDIVKRHQGE